MPHSIDQMRARLQMVQGFIKDWSFRERKESSTTCTGHTPKQCEDGAQWRHPVTLAKTQGQKVPAKDYRHVLPTQSLYCNAKKHKVYWDQCQLWELVLWTAFKHQSGTAVLFCKHKIPILLFRSQRDPSLCVHIRYRSNCKRKLLTHLP